MITVLQEVWLPERCFLAEFLYWVALKRLPLAIDDLRGGDYRFSRECELCADFAIDTPVSYSECEAAGLPPNPRYAAFIEDRAVVDTKFLERIEGHIDSLSKSDQAEVENMRQEALSHRKDIDNWDREFKQFLDYYKARLFIDLRDGKVVARGLKINGSSVEKIEVTIKNGDLKLEHLDVVTIDQNKWMYGNIDWDNSILLGEEYSFCWVQFDVESMLSLYPVPDLPTIGTIKSLCDVYILDQETLGEVPREARRGRPSLPWESFHVEVAARAKQATLPEKKEAAISEFIDWFRDQLGITVSRSSVGQKLTPYYRRIFCAD